MTSVSPVIVSATLPGPREGMEAARVSPWVRGPVWDGAWVLSAVWLVPAVIVLAWGRADPRYGPLDTFAFLLAVPLWIAHRFSSTWLAYFTSAYRPLLRSHPVRYVVVPAGVVLACFAVVLPPDDALPWTRAQRALALAILDYLLVTWHFAAQHFGALSLYRMRAGRGRSRAVRRLDLAFALGIGGVLVILAELLLGAVAFQDVWIDPWLPRAFLTGAQAGLRVVGTLLLVAATATMLVLEARADRPSLPRALYLVGLAGLVAVALHARSPFPFVVAWTGQHWLLALGLASLVSRAEPPPGASRWLCTWHAVNRRPWAFLLLLALLSALLLPVFEVEAAGKDDVPYGDRLFGAFAEALRASTWVPVLVALGLATAFLHYVLDRAVFRLRDPDVRAAARGLVDPSASRRPPRDPGPSPSNPRLP